MSQKDHSWLNRLFDGPLSALNTLGGNVLAASISAFLMAYATGGWTAALMTLESNRAGVVAGVAALFGFTKAYESSRKREEARKLAEQFKEIKDESENAAELLRKIADGQIKLSCELTPLNQRELADSIVAGLKDAGLATERHLAMLAKAQAAEHKDIQIYLNTADWMLRDALPHIRLLPGMDAKLDQLIDEIGAHLIPPAPLPTDNFDDFLLFPNLDFTGREEILAELHRRLEHAAGVALSQERDVTDSASNAAEPETNDASPRAVHFHPQAVSGEGGIGKSEIALEYAFRHAGDYAGRWWLDASRMALDNSIRSLAGTLGLAFEPRTPMAQITRAVRRKLCEKKEKHLLILDNLEEPERLEDLLLPPPARVLVTTRLHNLNTTRIVDFPIDVFRRSESIALLIRHRPDLQKSKSRAELDAVADHLGDHALSIALAAAYLRRHAHLLPAELHDRLKRAPIGDGKHVFERLKPSEHTHRYALNVAASFSLHLPEFRGTPAMKLLASAALCHPRAVPRELLYDASELSHEDADEWLARLGDVSILHADAAISMHKLMQEVIRVTIGEEEEQQTTRRLVGMLGKIFEKAMDYREWKRMAPFAQHAEAVVAHAERLNELDRAGDLANQFSVFYYQNAQYDAALHGFRHAERIDRTAFGDEHPEVAIVVNNIGGVHAAEGDLDGALKAFREAERIDRAAFGDNHPNVARDVNNIGSVLRDMGDLDGALKANEEAERIDRAAFGGNHPKVAIRVNNIGGVLQNKGDLDGALIAYQEAERIDRAAYGDNHPNVARDVNNIGSVQSARGDREGAVKCSDQAFRIFLRPQGPRSLSTLTGARNLSYLGHDPVAIAREVAGEEIAAELAEALKEADEKRGGGG